VTGDAMTGFERLKTKNTTTTNHEPQTTAATKKNGTLIIIAASIYDHHYYAFIMAAAKSSSSSSSLSPTALFFMGLLALQFGIQPIVTKKFTSPEIIKSTVIFTQEIVKLLIAMMGITLNSSSSWKDVTNGWTIGSWLRLALLPATIYLIQNLCSLLAYQNLDAITYNVLNPLVMEGVLPLNLEYYMNLSNATTAAADSKFSLSSKHFSHGVLPIMTASFLSGLAGAITQKSLQSGGGRNALMFTMELCVASILILLVSFATSEDGKQIQQRGFFDKWSLLTMVPILTNSAGGILVGLVIKYAGTIRKGFALIFGILISGIVQSLIDEDKSLSKEDIAGGALAALSLWMHATFPYADAPKKSKAKAE